MKEYFKNRNNIGYSKGRRFSWWYRGIVVLCVSAFVTGAVLARGGKDYCTHDFVKDVFPGPCPFSLALYSYLEKRISSGVTETEQAFQCCVEVVAALVDERPIARFGHRFAPTRSPSAIELPGIGRVSIKKLEFTGSHRQTQKKVYDALVDSCGQYFADSNLEAVITLGRAIGIKMDIWARFEGQFVPLLTTVYASSPEVAGGLLVSAYRLSVYEGRLAAFREGLMPVLLATGPGSPDVSARIAASAVDIVTRPDVEPVMAELATAVRAAASETLHDMALVAEYALTAAVDVEQTAYLCRLPLLRRDNEQMFDLAARALVPRQERTVAGDPMERIMSVLSSEWRRGRTVSGVWRLQEMFIMISLCRLLGTGNMIIQAEEQGPYVNLLARMWLQGRARGQPLGRLREPDGTDVVARLGRCLGHPGSQGFIIEIFYLNLGDAESEDPVDLLAALAQGSEMEFSAVAAELEQLEPVLVRARELHGPQAAGVLEPHLERYRDGALDLGDILQALEASETDAPLLTGPTWRDFPPEAFGPLVMSPRSPVPGWISLDTTGTGTHRYTVDCGIGTEALILSPIDGATVTDEGGGLVRVNCGDGRVLFLMGCEILAAEGEELGQGETIAAVGEEGMFTVIFADGEGERLTADNTYGDRADWITAVAVEEPAEKDEMLFFDEEPGSEPFLERPSASPPAPGWMPGELPGAVQTEPVAAEPELLTEDMAGSVAVDAGTEIVAEGHAAELPAPTGAPDTGMELFPDEAAAVLADEDEDRVLDLLAVVEEAARGGQWVAAVRAAHEVLISMGLASEERFMAVQDIETALVLQMPAGPVDDVITQLGAGDVEGEFREILAMLGEYHCVYVFTVEGEEYLWPVNEGVVNAAGELCALWRGQRALPTEHPVRTGEPQTFLETCEIFRIVEQRELLEGAMFFNVFVVWRRAVELWYADPARVGTSEQDLAEWTGFIDACEGPLRRALETGTPLRGIWKLPREIGEADAQWRRGERAAFARLAADEAEAEAIVTEAGEAPEETAPPEPVAEGTQKPEEAALPVEMTAVEPEAAVQPEAVTVAEEIRVVPMPVAEEPLPAEPVPASAVPGIVRLPLEAIEADQLYAWLVDATQVEGAPLRGVIPYLKTQCPYRPQKILEELKRRGDMRYFGFYIFGPNQRYLMHHAQVEQMLCALKQSGAVRSQADSILADAGWSMDLGGVLAAVRSKKGDSRLQEAITQIDTHSVWRWLRAQEERMAAPYPVLIEHFGFPATRSEHHIRVMRRVIVLEMARLGIRRLDREGIRRLSESLRVSEAFIRGEQKHVEGFLGWRDVKAVTGLAPGFAGELLYQFVLDNSTLFPAWYWLDYCRFQVAGFEDGDVSLDYVENAARALRRGVVVAWAADDRVCQEALMEAVRYARGICPEAQKPLFDEVIHTFETLQAAVPQFPECGPSGVVDRAVFGDPVERAKLEAVLGEDGLNLDAVRAGMGLGSRESALRMVRRHETEEFVQTAIRRLQRVLYRTAALYWPLEHAATYVNGQMGWSGKPWALTMRQLHTGSWLGRFRTGRAVHATDDFVAAVDLLRGTEPGRSDSRVSGRKIQEWAALLDWATLQCNGDINEMARLINQCYGVELFTSGAALRHFIQNQMSRGEPTFQHFFMINDNYVYAGHHMALLCAAIDRAGDRAVKDRREGAFALHAFPLLRVECGLQLKPAELNAIIRRLSRLEDEPARQMQRALAEQAGKWLAENREQLRGQRRSQISDRFRGWMGLDVPAAHADQGTKLAASPLVYFLYLRRYEGLRIEEIALESGFLVDDITVMLITKRASRIAGWAGAQVELDKADRGYETWLGQAQEVREALPTDSIGPAYEGLLRAMEQVERAAGHGEGVPDFAAAEAPFDFNHPEQFCEWLGRHIITQEVYRWLVIGIRSRRSGEGAVATCGEFAAALGFGTAGQDPYRVLIKSLDRRTHPVTHEPFTAEEVRRYEALHAVMRDRSLLPREGFDFENPDSFAEWYQSNNRALTGDVFVWLRGYIQGRAWVGTSGREELRGTRAELEQALGYRKGGMRNLFNVKDTQGRGLPVWYQILREEALGLPTADQVGEVRNLIVLLRSGREIQWKTKRIQNVFGILGQYYPRFQAALKLVAERRGVEPRILENLILQHLYRTPHGGGWLGVRTGSRSSDPHPLGLLREALEQPLGIPDGITYESRLLLLQL